MIKEPNIGFMQGRLSPIIDGKIQAFPKDYWENEFCIANQYGFDLMEWTADYEDLFLNPLMTEEGQEKVVQLSSRFSLKIVSITCDFFMQKPFFKEESSLKLKLLEALEKVIINSSKIGIKIIVIPLVDHSSIISPQEEKNLIDGLMKMTSSLEEKKMKIAFESDYGPHQLLAFISNFKKQCFGINYDTGNSASLGYSCDEEIETYGDYILNVHLKDRLLRGTTVPFGEGAVDFQRVIENLKKINYQGNYILQPARAKDDNHAEILLQYKTMISNYF